MVHNCAVKYKVYILVHKNQMVYQNVPNMLCGVTSHNTIRILYIPFVVYVATVQESLQFKYSVSCFAEFQ